MSHQGFQGIFITDPLPAILPSWSFQEGQSGTRSPSASTVTQATPAKTGYIFQYPAPSLVHSNFTPRSARLAPVIPRTVRQQIVWFGLQGFIKSFLGGYLGAQLFRRPKDEVVEGYRRRLDAALWSRCRAGRATSGRSGTGLPAYRDPRPARGRGSTRRASLTGGAEHPSTG